MSLNVETPLEDVLKYIKKATTSSNYSGIPIYVDPIGLQEVEKSMTSTVRNIDLNGVPLKVTLKLEPICEFGPVLISEIEPVASARWRVRR